MALTVACLNETLHLLTPWWVKWGLFYAEDILSKCEIQLVSFEYEYVNLVAAVIVWFSLQQLNAEYSKQASIWKFTGRARGGDRLIMSSRQTRYYTTHRQILFRSEGKVWRKCKWRNLKHSAWCNIEVEELLDKIIIGREGNTHTNIYTESLS